MKWSVNCITKKTMGRIFHTFFINSVMQAGAKMKGDIMYINPIHCMQRKKKTGRPKKVQYIFQFYLMWLT